MAERTINRDVWLAQIEPGVQAKNRDRWTKFLKDVAWWLHTAKEREDEETMEAIAGLLVYGIKTQEDLQNISDEKKEFRDTLKAEGVRPAICDILFNKYVAPAHAAQPREEQVLRLQIQQLHLLKLVSEEVNKNRKSRLNCWEKESARTTESKRDPNFRKKVIRYYQRESSSGKSVKCQILDKYVTLADAQDTIIAAHIWKASTRGKDLEEFGLCAEDVNSARNGLFLTKGLEDAFDNQRVCFLYNTLHKELCLWVADAKMLPKTIEGSNPPKKFADVHQKPLRCPDESHMPFRRLLSWHARLTLELRKESIQVSNYTSEYDLSPGRESATLDPISQAIDGLVEHGEDASVSD